MRKPIRSCVRWSLLDCVLGIMYTIVIACAIQSILSAGEPSEPPVDPEKHPAQYQIPDTVLGVLPRHESRVLDSSRIPFGPCICIVDKTDSGIDSALMARALRAWKHQVYYDFADLWDMSARIELCSQERVDSGGVWPLYLGNTDLRFGLLGYHHVDSLGIPFGVVWVDTTDKNETWTRTVSHEILEIIVNPHVNRYIMQTATPSFKALTFMEVADPVGAPQYCYYIDEILVSNFVSPQWFDNNLITRTVSPETFDFLGYTSAPFEILPQCYIAKNFIPSKYIYGLMN